jgi:hypothetical protein
VIRDNDTDHIRFGDIKYQVLEKEKQRNSPIWRYTVVCADSNERAHPTSASIHVIPPEETNYYSNLDMVLAYYPALYLSQLKQVFLNVVKRLDLKHKNVNEQKVYLKIQGKDIMLNKSFPSDYRIGCFVLPYVEMFITCDEVQAKILKFLFPQWRDKITFVKKHAKGLRL